MKGILTVGFTIIVSFLFSQCASSTLIISAYLEGSGSGNKCIEVYNGTGSNVNLSTYMLSLYSNGSPTPSQTMTLGPGIMLPGKSYVICHGNVTVFIPNQTNSSVMNFNGDDALALFNGTTMVDVFGQIGTDPGSQWGTGLCSTEDNTLARDLSGTTCPVDANGTDAFVPSDWANGGACLGVDNATPLNADPLPVKFSSISLKSTKNTNVLSYSTASEVNNDYFEIERSSDARVFTSIGKVEGAGTSNRTIDYTYTDEIPLSGTSYYRVKQVDLDGKFEYSDVVSSTGIISYNIKLKNRNNALEINTLAEGYNVYIYNTAGQMVESHTGLNNDQFIDLHNLESGVYIIKTQHGQLVETHKIHKL